MVTESRKNWPLTRRRAVTWIGLAAFLLAGGCNKEATSSSGAANPPPVAESGAPQSSASPVSQSDRDAITEAIQKHLADNKGINMAAMDVTLDSISINGDQAYADAAFRLKQGGTGMKMTYFLQRNANGWLVMRSQPGGDGQFVHPPMDKVHSGMASGSTGATGDPTPDITDFLKNHPLPKNN